MYRGSGIRQIALRRFDYDLVTCLAIPEADANVRSKGVKHSQIFHAWLADTMQSEKMNAEVRLFSPLLPKIRMVEYIYIYTYISIEIQLQSRVQILSLQLISKSRFIIIHLLPPGDISRIHVLHSQRLRSGSIVAVPGRMRPAHWRHSHGARQSI